MSGVNDIRSAFLGFFAREGHEIVPSSPLVPRNDPTLMFTNAGMVQFKNVFTGLEKRPYSRAMTAQKCVRAGGKHNDLDNVGYTARHHTFFEMLGNFSFGDYFKERAIELAWNLMTKEYGVPADQLTGDRLYRRRRGVQALEKDRRPAGPENPPHRRHRQFLEHGRHRAVRSLCGDFLRSRRQHSGAARPAAPKPRAIVSSKSGTSCSCSTSSLPGGKRIDLPRPSIDTGMGLERMAAVLQGTHDNYKIDLFGALIEAVADLTGVDPRRRAESVASRHRRPSARQRVPDRRWRAAIERRPRLCASPHHAPRHAPCRTARRQGPADVAARAGAGARDGPGLSGIASRRGADHRDAEARRNPFPPHAGARPCDPRRGEQDAEERRHVRRRDRVHALRHLWLSARSDAGCAKAARHRRRYRVVHRRHGASSARRRARRGRAPARRPTRRCGSRCAKRSAPPNFSATRPRMRKASSPRWCATARKSPRSRKARAARSFSTRRRSTANPAVRSATPAS